MTENPDEDEIIIVNDLNSLKAKFNKSQAEMVKSVVQAISPQGVKDIQSMAKDWGQILLKVCNNEGEKLM